VSCALDERIDRPRRETTVGIDDNDQIGGSRLEVRDAEGERVPLTPMVRFTSLDHLGPSGSRYLGGVVRAVVGDDDDAIAGSKLHSDICDGARNALSFIMGRD